MISIYKDIKEDQTKVREKIIKLVNIVYSTTEDTNIDDTEMFILHEQLICLMEYEERLEDILDYIIEQNNKPKPLLS